MNIVFLSINFDRLSGTKIFQFFNNLLHQNLGGRGACRNTDDLLAGDGGHDLLGPEAALTHEVLHSARPRFGVVGWNLNLPVKPRVLWNELGLEPEYPTIDTGLPAALEETISRHWRHPHADGQLYRRNAPRA